MTYNEAIDWLFVQFPAYQSIGKVAYKSDLSNIKKLASYLGNPEIKFKSIHVAGTNGKGSTSHMMASVLQEAGYKVGLYTSPHLKDFRERIKINGQMILKNDVVDFVTQHQDFFKVNQLSFFEMTVGMAFQYFASAEVDIAIIEVGLGGRLDSTNIITPEVSVITNIGLDHTAFLGNTLSEIAKEKAGVIKAQVPCLIGRTTVETKKVFVKVATKNNAPIYFVNEKLENLYKTDLGGVYQQENLKTAFSALEILKTKQWNISGLNYELGFANVIKNTGLQGRWQVLNKKPYIVCDTAHNEDGLTYVIKQIQETKKEYLHVVLGMVNDKDLDQILPLFPKNATYYFTQPNNRRALTALELQLQAAKYELKGNVYPSVLQAFEFAKKAIKDTDMLYVGGSTFVVAEIL